MNSSQKRFLWIQNSSHVIDLLYHVLGEISILQLDKSKFNDTEFNTFNAYLKTQNDIPVQLNAIWNSPSNFGIRFYVGNRIYEMKPLEFLNIYEGFDIIEPTQEIPVRRYHPKLLKSQYANSTNNSFKPGFLNQTKYFLFSNESEFQPAILKDALYITQLIESIILI